MPRLRSAEQARGKSKNVFAVEELTRGIEIFQDSLAQVEDLSREGFPYRDAARARAELHIRHSVKRIFGDKSPEYQTYKTHKLRINRPEETAQSIALLKGLIASLENRKLDLLGIKPAPPLTSDASSPTQPAQARPQLSLVPPPGAPAQVIITPMAGTAASVVPPPITMSVALTTNLGTPPTNQTPPTPDAGQAGAVRQTLPQHQPSSPNVAAAQAARSETGFQVRPAPPSEPVVSQQPHECSTPSQPLSSSTQSAPTLAFLVAMPAQETNACPPVSTSAPVQSSESRTEQSAAPIAPSSASVGENAAPSALTTHPQARAKMRVSEASRSDPDPRPGDALSIRGTDIEGFLLSEPRGNVPLPFVPHARSALDPLEQVRKLCSRFHAVVRQMRLRREYRATLEVEDEYDVQDLLHALLRLEFDEIEIEDWMPGYTEGGNRTTFFLAKNTIAVVAKKTRPGLGGREVAEQLQIDSERYRARKSCGTLLCFVYDPEGRIGNPRGFEADLTSVSDTYTVEVLVAPK